MTVIAKNIRTALERPDINQKELAELSGVSGAHISQIMHGKREPSVKIIRKISAALNCPLAELLEDDSALNKKKRRVV